jgi:hypothetical protein
VLDVQTPGGRTQLFPRTFPELAQVIGGVFYAGELSADRSANPADKSYVFESSGADGVGPFKVAVAPPPSLGQLTLDGQALDAIPSVARGRDAVLSWAGGDPGDYLEVTLTARGRTLVCSAQDDGELRLPLADWESATATDRIRLIVRRVRARSFQTPAATPVIRIMTKLGPFSIPVR